jgi:preprotein translocase subunit Sss1
MTYFCKRVTNNLKSKVMKTLEKNQNTENNTYLIVIGSGFILFGVIGFIFHISPKQIALALSEFAEHHYLLMSFISFVLGMLTISYYYDLKKSNADFISRIKNRNK